jgi:hypothetical protein
MTSQHRALQVSDAIAARLTDLAVVPGIPAGQPWWRQSLAHGAPGIALLHIERAAAGRASWRPAQDWLSYICTGPVTAGPDSFLFYGAPALAHALACAAEYQPGWYQRALERLDRQIALDAISRVSRAHARMDSRQLPDLAEFDTIRGLTGIGSYLLCRDPEGAAMNSILGYLVRLTEPVADNDGVLPGWWTPAGPSGRASGKFPGGHGNLGMAHGISGALALMSLSITARPAVAGQHQAIARICGWLCQWQDAAGWPYWVNRAHARAGQHNRDDGPRRLGWCYGTVGVARAIQLAGQVTGESALLNTANGILAGVLADPRHRAVTNTACLCHGSAGLAHLAATSAADASRATASRIRAAVPGLLDALAPECVEPGPAAARLLTQSGPGLLEGAAGCALAILRPAGSLDPRSRWDACLLIN